jgi:hypothetical protein
LLLQILTGAPEGIKVYCIVADEVSMTQPMTLAPDTRPAPGAPSRTTRREARLRPEHAHLYPSIPAGVWELAAVLGDRIVAARLLGDAKLAIQGRALMAEHFDFRGGTGASTRPRREDR